MPAAIAFCIQRSRVATRRARKGWSDVPDTEGPPVLDRSGGDHPGRPCGRLRSTTRDRGPYHVLAGTCWGASRLPGGRAGHVGWFAQSAKAAALVGRRDRGGRSLPGVPGTVSALGSYMLDSVLGPLPHTPAYEQGRNSIALPTFRGRLPALERLGGASETYAAEDQSMLTSREMVLTTIPPVLLATGFRAQLRRRHFGRAHHTSCRICFIPISPFRARARPLLVAAGHRRAIKTNLLQCAPPRRDHRRHVKTSAIGSHRPYPQRPPLVRPVTGDRKPRSSGR
jgi:hypothetical protein